MSSISLLLIEIFKNAKFPSRESLKQGFIYLKKYGQKVRLGEKKWKGEGKKEKQEKKEKEKEKEKRKKKKKKDERKKKEKNDTANQNEKLQRFFSKFWVPATLDHILLYCPYFFTFQWRQKSKKFYGVKLGWSHDYNGSKLRVIVIHS